MARYIQRIALLGKERWIGWEVDGVGTEIPGLTLADGLSDDELRARGVKEFRPMPFESFLGLGAIVSPAASPDLLDEDVEYRLDALLVGMERIRAQGQSSVPRALILGYVGDDAQLGHPRVQQRFREWEEAGSVQVVGSEECYLSIVGRLA
ncbi:MAG TPA: hypothetical protein VGF28_14585 [Thermoanaerobaculia bacterium]|jgi:hypothetical protein